MARTPQRFREEVQDIIIDTMDAKGSTVVKLYHLPYCVVVCKELTINPSRAAQCYFSTDYAT